MTFFNYLKNQNFSDCIPQITDAMEYQYKKFYLNNFNEVIDQQLLSLIKLISQKMPNKNAEEVLKIINNL
jgi:hypothetical protein